MDYKGLYEAVAASLMHGMSFAIEVKTWRHRDASPSTEWEVYIADWSETFTGPTSQDAFDAFKRGTIERETLEQTSAAVGTAEVDA